MNHPSNSDFVDAPPDQPGRARIVAATVAGNALEFYDFLAYSYFAVYIAKAFFPSSDAMSSLLISVAVFGVGFITRPLGGILIGLYADRAGRRPALLLTIGLITAGTLGLALTPTYDSIGMWAPLLVVTARLLQGLGLGGEIGPSTAFLIETAPAHQRGLYGSWQLASQGLGILAAGSLGVALTTWLDVADMQAWGWRIPFVLGLVLIPVALYLRSAMPETLHAQSNASPAASSSSIGHYKTEILIAVLSISGATITTYLGNYMTTYAITTLHFPANVSMLATLILGVGTLVFSLIGGWFYDRHTQKQKQLLIAPRIALTVLAYPSFLWLTHEQTPMALYIVTFGMAALTSLSAAPMLTLIPQIFPNHCRAAGMSIAYAVGVAVFGGTTQFVVAWLIQITGDPTSPTWYVAGANVVAAIALHFLCKKPLLQ